MAYEVHLEVFEGPFDLLLQLIARRRLEVTDVDLSDITSDFLEHLDSLDEVDLETATRFLVVAATLIELKAARLLPSDERDEVDDLLAEARDMLYARLLEYRAFRQMADHIGLLVAASEPYVAREVPLEPHFRRLVPETPLAADAAALARLAAQALAPPPVEVVDLAHVRRQTISIRDAATALLDRLRRGAGSFQELTEGRARHERVVWFLAALELFKLGHLELEQPDLRGPLHLASRAGGRDLESLVEADLSAADEPDAPSDQPVPSGATVPSDQAVPAGARRED